MENKSDERDHILYRRRGSWVGIITVNDLEAWAEVD